MGRVLLYGEGGITWHACQGCQWQSGGAHIGRLSVICFGRSETAEVAGAIYRV